MDLLNVEAFHRLIRHHNANSISIYLPTYKAGREIQQNPIRFKNLINEAQRQLQKKGVRHPDAQAYLQPLGKLLNVQDFWRNQEQGLAVFQAPDFHATYRLPLKFSQTVVVNRRFHIKPLLPLFVENERFYLLALSQKNVRLFSGTRFDVAEIDLGDTPTSIEAALQYDDPERELQFHTNTAATGGGRDAMFHGHAPDNDELKNIARFFHKVNQGVMDTVGDQSAPLILAGVDYLLPIYQDVNTYAHLIEEGIPGNPDHLSPKELHQAGWRMIEPRVTKRRQDAIERYQSFRQEKRSDRLLEVVPASYHARVETLFVPLERQVWGFYDPDTDTVMRQEKENPDSRDLIDLAVIHTLQNGGEVQFLSGTELPVNGDRPIAAIFRY